MISESASPTASSSHEHGLTVSLETYWNRIGLALVLVLAAFLNFVGLAREGYGNTYYAAAVRSMMQNWHAFFFNSLDPAGFVTLDKPPLGFWLQVASTKVFGFNGVALMLPQACAGVLSVALVYLLVGRGFGRPAGLVAALVLALTPISVVANRNNIVDSTLVLVVLLGAWAVTRATETGKIRWLLLCALFVGLGFNIKMLQAYLVLPAFGLMYLAGAGIGWRRRIVHLAAAAVVLLTVSLSWVIAVDVTPASQRPWVGSTTTNSALDLAIGYNGLQRLTGNSGPGNHRFASGVPRTGATATGQLGTAPGDQPGGPGGLGGPGGVGENGNTGPFRLLNAELGPQVGWLLPLAVIGLLVAAWQTRRRRWRLDSKQSSLVLWGMWLLTMSVFFSIAGFFHTYYLVMIAPAIAALSGIGLISLWQAYREPRSRQWFALPVSLGAAAAIQVHLASVYPDWSRWLTPLIVGGSLVAAAILTLAHLWPGRFPRSLFPAALIGIMVLLAAPATWSVTSVKAANSGLTPRAGPDTANGFGPGGSRGFQPPPGAFGQGPRNGAGPLPGGTFPPPAGFQGFGPRTRMNRITGGPGNQQINPQLLRYLEAHRGKAIYLFATNDAGTAEPYIIATGEPVMAMGGFTGSDPILTPAKLATLVRHGTIRYFVLDEGGFGGAGNVSSWVQQNCRSVAASAYTRHIVVSAAGRFGSGQQLYDCAAPK